MYLYEDDLGEEPPCSETENEDEEQVPVSVIPNIVLPKALMPCTMEPCGVKIVWSEAPNLFYIQLKYQEDYFDMFSKNLNAHYSALKDPPLNTEDLPVLSTWAAQYEGKWYRAIVLTKAKEGQGRPPVFKMKFTDLGFSKLVSLKKIRYLEEEFTLDPPFVHQCGLFKVYPLVKWTEKPWSKEALDYFSFVCKRSKHMIAIFIKGKEDYHLEVILETSKGEVINEEMVKKGFASSKVIKKFFTETVEDDSLSKSFKPSDCSTLETKKRDSIQTTELDWDPMADEYVSGANAVYVNNESAELALNGFENDDKTICRSFKFKGTCHRGETCRWKHVKPRKDGLSCGSVETYLFLEDDFDLPEVGSHLIAVVSTIYSPHHFYIQVLSYDYPSTLNGSMKINDSFVELQRNLMSTYKGSKGCLTPPLPTVGELMVVCSSKDPLEGFYRVRVLLVRETDVVMVKVFYIDVGMTDWVKENQLRPLLPMFLRPHALAFRCNLSDISPPTSEGWGLEAKKLFSDYIKYNLQTVIVMRVDDMMEDEISVIMMNPEVDRTINEMLVEKRLAKVENIVSSALMSPSI